MEGTRNQLVIAQLSNDGLVFTDKEQGHLSHLPAFPTAEHFRFSQRTGLYCAVIDAKGVYLLNTVSGAIDRTILNDKITVVDFSPLETHLLTCEKYTPSCSNLCLWNIASGKQLAAFEWKRTPKEAPQFLRWTADEKFAARQSSAHTIDIFDPAVSLQEPSTTITLDRVDGFEFCP